MSSQAFNGGSEISFYNAFESVGQRRVEERIVELIVTIPDGIASFVEALAKQSGESPEQLVIKALLAHFPPIPAALQEEFDALEAASDADAAAFEASLR